jgi:hypothetical protein
VKHLVCDLTRRSAVTEFAHLRQLALLMLHPRNNSSVPEKMPVQARAAENGC